VRASFALPEHHKVNEGVVSCIDCHGAHGSRDRGALRGTNNRECFRCHAEIEGPYVFEHEALLAEGCVACHVPHGGVNRHLLLRQQVAQLCYQCHTVTPADHVQPSFRDCTRCHVSIHGSNVQPHFLEQ
jgi:DmsE family decaheme c-type cytochrome